MYDPLTAETLAAMVRTLAWVVGLVANDAVTPMGKVEVTDSVTLPANPPRSTTPIVVVPELPGLRVKLLAEVESWNPGEDVAGAMPLIKF